MNAKAGHFYDSAKGGVEANSKSRICEFTTIQLISRLHQLLSVLLGAADDAQEKAFGRLLPLTLS